MSRITISKSNKGQITGKTISTVVIGIIILTVILASYSSIVPEAQSSGDTLGDAQRCVDAGGSFDANDRCSSNGSVEGTQVSFSAIPLSGLFSGTGPRPACQTSP